LTLQLIGVRKSYGDTPVLDDVSLTLAAREFIAFLGPSGSGKSTLLRIIAGLERADAGEILLDGKRIDQLPPGDRGVAMVFQHYALYPHMSVRENMAFGLRNAKVAKDEIERRIADAAAVLQIEELLDRKPAQMSGGQRQRVAIAAALVLEPKLLVADEPVSMLDVSVRAGILDLLDGLRRGGLGILMITHDLSTATQYADRILVMYLGRIVEEGPARAVVADPRHPYTKALISVVPRRDPHDRRRPQILQGETPNPIDIPAGCRFHPRCPIGDDACRAVDPQLEPAAGHRAACIKQ